MNLLSIKNRIGVVLDSDPDAVSKLRMAFIDLQADIAEVCPPARYERANDPVMLRVVTMFQRMTRLEHERSLLLDHMESIVHALEDNIEDGQMALNIANLALLKRNRDANVLIDVANRALEKLQEQGRA